MDEDNVQKMDSVGGLLRLWDVRCSNLYRQFPPVAIMLSFIHIALTLNGHGDVGFRDRTCVRCMQRRVYMLPYETQSSTARYPQTQPMSNFWV